MKKACLFGLSLLLCLGLIGCGGSNPQPSGSPAQTAAATDAAANAPAVSFTEEDVRAMLPMMDSVMLCLTEGAAESHTFSDASYVWSLLYYLCVNHPSVSSHIAIDDQAGTLSISAEDLLSLASACFENPSSLPAVLQNKSIYHDAFRSRLQQIRHSLHPVYRRSYRCCHS